MKSIRKISQNRIKQVPPDAKLLHRQKCVSKTSRAPEGATGPTNSPGEVEQKLALLLRVPSIFDDVQPDELRKMAAATEWVTALSGGEMVTQGDLGDAMFIVASGSLDATIRDIGPVRSYGPHDFFGEQGLAGPVGGV